jgi:hypothetical protein
VTPPLLPPLLTPPRPSLPLKPQATSIVVLSRTDTAAQLATDTKTADVPCPRASVTNTVGYILNKSWTWWVHPPPRHPLRCKPKRSPAPRPASALLARPRATLRPHEHLRLPLRLLPPFPPLRHHRTVDAGVQQDQDANGNIVWNVSTVCTPQPDVRGQTQGVATVYSPKVGGCWGAGLGRSAVQARPPGASGRVTARANESQVPDRACCSRHVASLTCLQASLS